MRYIFAFALILALPALAFAQGSDIFDVLKTFQAILNWLVPIAVTLALFFFIWGLAIYIKNSGSEEAKAEGRRKMIGGIIALFVVVGIWGIVKFIGRTVGVEPGGSIDIPQFPGADSSSRGGDSYSGPILEGRDEPAR